MWTCEYRAAAVLSPVSGQEPLLATSVPTGLSLWPFCTYAAALCSAEWAGLTTAGTLGVHRIGGPHPGSRQPGGELLGGLQGRRLRRR